MRDIDVVSADSQDGDGQTIGTTPAEFEKYVNALPVFGDGGAIPVHDILTISIASHVVKLPFPASLGHPNVQAFDESLTALTFADGTAVQCMRGGPPQSMGALTMPGRGGVFQVKGPRTTSLCTLGPSRHQGRFNARLDGFLSDTEMFIIHVSSSSVELLSMAVSCLGQLSFDPSRER